MSDSKLNGIWSRWLIDRELDGQQTATMRKPWRRVRLADGGTAVPAPLAGMYASLPAIDRRVHDALTDMYTYAHALEAESQRLAGRPDDRAVREELEAFRDTITALRTAVDPVGTWL